MSRTATPPPRTSASDGPTGPPVGSRTFPNVAAATTPATARQSRMGNQAMNPEFHPLMLAW